MNKSPQKWSINHKFLYVFFSITIITNNEWFTTHLITSLEINGSKSNFYFLLHQSHHHCQLLCVIKMTTTTTKIIIIESLNENVNLWNHNTTMNNIWMWVIKRRRWRSSNLRWKIKISLPKMNIIIIIILNLKMFCCWQQQQLPYWKNVSLNNCDEFHNWRNITTMKMYIVYMMTFIHSMFGVITCDHKEDDSPRILIFSFIQKKN